MSLLEIMVSLSVVMVVLLGLLQSIASSMRTTGMNREVALATEAARLRLEILRAADFDEAFARFNGDPNDDPDGAGTAPGFEFDVDGLNLPEGVAEAHVGRIEFPAVEKGGGGLALREDLQDAGLGMPLDLNVDGAVDAADHAGDYELLPVRVVVEWRSPSGTARVELKTILGRY